jgi:hypothetical protein
MANKVKQIISAYMAELGRRSKGSPMAGVAAFWARKTPAERTAEMKRRAIVRAKRAKKRGSK